MKKLVGSDIGTAAFDAAAGTITFAGIPAITLANILVITDVTAGVMLYNFADASLGGVLTGSTLYLELDTAGLNSTDVLQCWLDLPGNSTVDTGLVQPLTNTQLRASAVPVSGTVSTGLNQPLTDAQLRAAAVQVSGPLTDAQLRATSVAVSGPLTDAQLRATAVPVSGTVSTGLSQPLTDTQLRASAVPVSGPLTDTQLRATPVSVEVSNFPTGGGDAKDETLREIADILSHLGSIISYPSTVDRSLNRQRVTAAIESGTVTTVSTVTNVTNLNNLGGFSTVMVAQDLNFNAWSNSVGARF